MKIFIATDITVRLFGEKVYARYKYTSILRRYYNAFGSMVICSRVEKIDALTDDCDDITDMVDSVLPVPSLMNTLLGRFNSEIRRAMRRCDLVICRCPSITAYRAADCAKKEGKPYITESMGCAWDAYWNHGILGKLIAPYMFFKMRKTVRDADYASYVTSEFLQRRYPCRCESLSASNVKISEINREVLENRLNKIDSSDSGEITLMTTAAVNVKYKGHQYVIRAIPLLNQKGLRVKYCIVGDGDPAYLRGVAEKCGVADQVVFAGRLPIDRVFERLDETDIYIQPSLQEGLPRSVIEAMSRACPCLGAKTAGIPELLDGGCVFKRKSPEGIVRAILSNFEKDKLKSLAVRNFEASKEYSEDVLNEKRSSFYRKIAAEIGEK